jgi:glucose-6-phosphate 1-epimerase
MQSQLPNGVARETDPHGLERLRITTPAAEAVVYFQGAHVTHYQSRGQAPVLFMSARSRFAAGQPIRGGVPVIFPWFGPHPFDPNAPAHGFARTTAWSLGDVRRSGEAVTITLVMGSAKSSVRLRYAVTIGAALDLALTVQNQDARALQFQEALHTYLAVSDVGRVSIKGLSGRDYVDKVDGMKRKTQRGALRITGETDRVYLDTSDTVTVDDPGMNRRILVSKEGSSSTVVWNPWVEKAVKMPDFGDDEWTRMLCVETANVADNAVTLAPGATHVMRAMVRVE